LLSPPRGVGVSASFPPFCRPGLDPGCRFLPQILTLAELFQGKWPNIPLMDLNVGKSAKREDVDAGKQGSLL
jgi:hypothetical protein